jgi:hypothetical protein
VSPGATSNLQALDFRFGPYHGRPRLRSLRPKRGRIDLRKQIALVNDRIEVRVQRLDDAGHLGSDLDRRHRLQRANRPDGLNDVAPRDGRTRRFQTLIITARVVRAGRSDRCYRRCCEHPGNCVSFHDWSARRHGRAGTFRIGGSRRPNHRVKAPFARREEGCRTPHFRPRTSRNPLFTGYRRARRASTIVL